VIDTMPAIPVSAIIVPVSAGVPAGAQRCRLATLGRVAGHPANGFLSASQGLTDQSAACLPASVVLFNGGCEMPASAPKSAD